MAPSKSYPYTATVKCAGCSCMVEVRFDSYKQTREKVFCRRPCTPSKPRVNEPKIIKVYNSAIPASHDEYTIALRKHKGLEVL